MRFSAEKSTFLKKFEEALSAQWIQKWHKLDRE